MIAAVRSFLLGALCFGMAANPVFAQATSGDVSLAEQDAQVLAQARKDLRSNSKARQLQAVRAASTIVSHEHVCDSDPFAKLMQAALVSEHKEVLRAAVGLLCACPDSQLGQTLLASRLEDLADPLRKLKRPKWPTVRLLPKLLNIPPLPPLGGSKADKQRFKQRLAAQKRKQRARDQKRKRENAQLAREIERARKLDFKVWQAGRALGQFCHALGDANHDIAAELLLRAMTVAQTEEPAVLNAIVAAVCKHPRRDLIERCVALMEWSKLPELRTEDRRRMDCQRFLFGQLSKSERKRRNARVSHSFWGGKEPPAIRSNPTGVMRSQLGTMGEGFGVAAPVYPKLTKQDLGRVLIDPDFRLPGPDKSWQAWWQEVREHVPERLAPR